MRNKRNQCAREGERSRDVWRIHFKGGGQFNGERFAKLQQASPFCEFKKIKCLVIKKYLLYKALQQIFISHIRAAFSPRAAFSSRRSPPQILWRRQVERDFVHCDSFDEMETRLKIQYVYFFGNSHAFQLAPFCLMILIIFDIALNFNTACTTTIF